ncbi:hypothetical protein [Streptomyces sp. NPDC098781]|uniref:effector-associated constant component EACC1 n=1 Tax=Streptomyces sp. NPDC098781 TaxID=3366097 RepID=UPI00382D4B3B
MQIAIAARDDGGRIGTDDLRGWLGRQRELRGCVKRGSAGTPDRGTMGTATELITVFLAPGGVATVLAAAVVAWVQNRSGSQTVTITCPDGTEVTVTSDRVRGLTAQATGELAQQIAGYLEPQSQQEPTEQGQQAAQARHTPQNTEADGSADASGTEPRPDAGDPDSEADGRHP